jgi:hypothetical protein
MDMGYVIRGMDTRKRKTQKKGEAKEETRALD